LLQACGESASQESDDGDFTVEMNDQMQFAPDHLTIRSGQTITWRNVGNMVHTSTSDPAWAQDAAHATVPDGAKPWNSGLIRKGESWRHTFEVPGEYAYFCIPHEAAGMVASITVEE
jgi:plastocyanin